MPEQVGMSARLDPKRHATVFGDRPAVIEQTDSLANYRLVTHFKFLSVGPDQNMVTERP